MKLDPITLRLFVAVMEENAIARAAAREHIAPSAASRRLAELEDQLQLELFTRSNRGSQPTAAAYALLNMARGVLNELDGIATQMKDYAQGGEQGLRGHVRVMANISSITQFLPAQLQSFLSRHPLVDVRLQERVSTDIARAVADNEAEPTSACSTTAATAARSACAPIAGTGWPLSCPNPIRWPASTDCAWNKSSSTI